MLIKRNKYFSAIEEEEYLDQKEFNSKAQKARRRVYDAKVGEARLGRINPNGAETAFIHGKASFPGENVNRVYREGANWHYKTETRPGVSPEKAKMLENNVSKLKGQNPKRFRFQMDLVGGRDELHSTQGYSSDLSKVNQRINAKGLGDREEALEAGKEELRKRKNNGWKSKSNPSASAKSTATASKAVTKNSGKLLKKAGIGALAVGTAAGIGYGAKKLYDKKKKKKNADQGNK